MAARLSEVSGITKPVLILIAGGSGSGKTTFTGMLKVMLDCCGISVASISMDDFYKILIHDNVDPKTVNFDDPDAINFGNLKKTLTALFANCDVTYPKYDFKTHNHSDENITQHASQVIIVEGIHALYEPLIVNDADFKIFIDATEDHRHDRRIERSVKVWKRSLEESEEQYAKQVKPAFDKFIAPCIDLPKIIKIPNDLEMVKMFNCEEFKLFWNSVMDQLGKKSNKI